MNKLKHCPNLQSYLQLGKLSVIFPVSLTAFTGFFLFHPGIGLNILFVTLGVFFLGFSASALNQIQESSLDGQMERTQNRPIPSGRISKKHAAYFVVFCSIAGGILLFTGGNLLAMSLGFATILWYNGIYTPMKKRTAFAVIPGALTGAIPPVIGWVSAGGHIADHTSIFLAFLFFIGQVPHFWLLILKYGDQYKKAGLPSLNDVFSIRQINNLSFIWIVASLVSGLMLASFGIIQNTIPNIVLIIITLIAISQFIRLLNNENTDKRKRNFVLLNLYFMALMLILVSDRLIG